MEANIYTESLFLKLIGLKILISLNFSELSSNGGPSALDDINLDSLESLLAKLSDVDNKIKILVNIHTDLPNLLNLEEIQKKHEQKNPNSEEQIAQNNPEYGKAEVFHEKPEAN